MKFLTFKNFIIASLVIHFFAIILISISNNEKREKIVINLNQNIVEEDSIPIEDISDESIFEEMKKIEALEQNKNKQLASEKAALNRELKKEREALSKLKAQKDHLNSEISAKSKDLKKTNQQIKKLDDRKKSLEKDNKKLDKIKKDLNKEIKKKERKPRKVTQKKSNKKAYKKDNVYQSAFSKYVVDIGYRFRKNWIIPVNAEENWACTVKVIQDNKGQLKDFELFDNCPADPDFLRSIDRAIKESTPLPTPPKKLDFDDIKEITLEFKLNS